MKPNKVEIALIVAILLDMVGFTMLIPDIQLRAEKLIGPSPFTGPVIGLLLQSTFIVQFLVSPKWGRMADRTGRKRVFIGCQWLSALAMLLYGASTSLVLLFASRIIAGFGAANVSTAQAIAASQAEEGRKKIVLGWMSAALSGGMILGPAIGGLGAAALGHSAVGYLGAGISFAGGFLVWLFVPNDTHRDSVQREQSRRFFDLSFLNRYPEVRPIFWIAVIASFALATLEGTFGRLIHQILGMGQAEFGILFSFEAVIGVLMSAYGLTILSKRICETSLLRAGYLFQGIGLGLNPLAGLLSSIAPGLFWLFVASTLYAIGAGVVNPMLASLASNAVPDESQGELFGTMQSARTIGFIIGPILGGALFDIWAPAPYIIATTVCIGVAIFLPAICKCHPRLAKPI